MRDTQEFQERIGRIDGLVQKLETAADPVLRRTAKDLVQSLMELHGAGFERLLEIVSENNGGTGAVLVQALGHDPLVSSLLVLYGLHPEDFETRVRRGLEKVRPQLRSEGAHAELITAAEATIHVKIVGAGSNNLEPEVRAALLETAPDATNVIIEGGIAAKQSSSFVPLSSLKTLSGSPVAIAEAS